MSGMLRFPDRCWLLEPKPVQFCILNQNVKADRPAFEGFQAGILPLYVVLNAVGMHRLAVLNAETFLQVCPALAVPDHITRYDGCIPGRVRYSQWLVDADADLDLAMAGIHVQLEHFAGYLERISDQDLWTVPAERLTYRLCFCVSRTP